MNLKDMTNEKLVVEFQNTRDEKFFNELYRRNYKLITKVASKRKEYDKIMVSYDDYLSECNIAFFKATESFVVDSSAKFSSVVNTYMDNACKQLIRRMNMKKRNNPYINISIHSQVKKNKDDGILIEETIAYDDSVFDECELDINELYNILRYKVYRKHVDILNLLNEGYTQKEISIKFGCSPQKICASVKAMRLVAIECGFKG